MFKDKQYYINKAKEVLGIFASAFLFDLFIFVLFVMWARGY